jgi:DeoR-like helix-turn-helix domain
MKNPLPVGVAWLYTIFLVFVVCIPSTGLAHGEGASQDQLVGAYLTDMGYSPETPHEGDILALDFQLWLAQSTSTPVEFDQVFVRVKQSGTLLLSTNVTKNILGKTAFSFVPPVSGPVLVFAQYERDGETLAEATFPLTIAPQERTLADNIPLLLAGAIGLIVGFGIALLLHKRGATREGDVNDSLEKARAAIQDTKESRHDQILALLNTQDEITNNDVEKCLQVSDRTATRYLEELVQEGRLQQVGSTGKSVSYRLIKPAK